MSILRRDYLGNKYDEPKPTQRDYLGHAVEPRDPVASQPVLPGPNLSSLSIKALTEELKRRRAVQWAFVEPGDWASVTILDGRGLPVKILSEERGPCLVFVVTD